MPGFYAVMDERTNGDFKMQTQDKVDHWFGLVTIGLTIIFTFVVAYVVLFSFRWHFNRITTADAAVKVHERIGDMNAARIKAAQLRQLAQKEQPSVSAQENRVEPDQ